MQRSAWAVTLVADSNGRPLLRTEGGKYHSQVDMRRSTRLIISSISTVGNYEYGFFWKLMLDGQIECEVQATGIISTSVSRAIIAGTWVAFFQECQQ